MRLIKTVLYSALCAECCTGHAGQVNGVEKMKKILFLVSLSLLMAGCASVMDAGNLGRAAGSDGPHVYGGVRGDMQLIGESDSAVSTTMLVLDMVPSVFYDTALLPASISKACSK